MTLFGIPSDRGIVRTIIIIVVALLVLSYFGYNLRSIWNSPNTQDNFSFVIDGIKNIWNNYLKTPATYIWNIFINLIWNPAIENLQKINNNEPDNIRASAPQLPPAQLVP